MKLLIGASSSKIFHLKEFATALEKENVEVRLVKDTDYSRGFPSKKISEWFNGDKKFKESQIRFVLISQIGNATISKEITLDNIKESFSVL